MWIDKFFQMTKEIKRHSKGYFFIKYTVINIINNIINCLLHWNYFYIIPRTYIIPIKQIFSASVGFNVQVIFWLWRHLATLFTLNSDKSFLRGRHNVIWQHLLLKIAMTYLLYWLRVRTLIINTDNILPRACLGKYPSPPTPTCQSNFV